MGIAGAAFAALFMLLLFAFLLMLPGTLGAVVTKIFFNPQLPEAWPMVRVSMVLLGSALACGAPVGMFLRVKYTCHGRFSGVHGWRLPTGQLVVAASDEHWRLEQVFVDGVLASRAARGGGETHLALAERESDESPYRGGWSRLLVTFDERGIPQLESAAGALAPEVVDYDCDLFV